MKTPVSTLFSGFACLLATSLHAQTPVLVKDINPSGDSYPYVMAAYNGRLIFQADNGTYGTELWISDGTESGTTMVKDIKSGSGSSSPKDFAVFNGKVFFVANGSQLWQTDGTEPGTTSLAAVSSADLSTCVILGDALYFVASDGVHGRELWKTDGTEEGTVMVKDINPSGNTVVRGFAELNGFIYFGAYDGVENELWRTDGTDEGTTKFVDINPDGSSVPYEFATMNGQIFFQANDGVHGGELWKTDGTVEGTVMVKDVRGGSASSSLYGFTRLNGRLCFIALTDEYGWEPWVTDGTEAGTYLLADTEAGVNTSGVGSAEFTLLNDLVLFVGADQELWRTDGTQAGTVRVKNINPEGTSYPYELTLLGNYVYFAADDGTHGSELWRTDGTEAGTTLVYDTLPGSGYGDAYPIVRVGGSLFYGATGATGGNELYMLEGGGLLDASSLSYSDGQFQITVEGVSGQHLQIDSSEGLSNWTYLHDGIVVDGKLTVIDPNAGSHPNRSYRAKVASEEI